MMSSHPWSDSQVQGFFRLLLSREMFPSHEEGESAANANTARGAGSSVPGPPPGADPPQKGGREGEEAWASRVAAGDSCQPQGHLQAESGGSRTNQNHL